MSLSKDQFIMESVDTLAAHDKLKSVSLIHDVHKPAVEAIQSTGRAGRTRLHLYRINPTTDGEHCASGTIR